MRVALAIVILCCVCFPQPSSAAGDTPATETTNSIFQAELRLSTLGEMPAEKLLDLCRNRMRRIGVPRDQIQWNAETDALILAMHQKPIAASGDVMRAILAHPSPLDYVKADALRLLYLVAGDKAEVRSWIDSDNDKLRATALELLAPELTGEAAFDEAVDRIMAEKPGFSQTWTDTVLAGIVTLREFRESYQAAGSADEKASLLASRVSWLYEPRYSGGDWFLSKDAFPQYLLRQMKMLYHDAPRTVRTALAKHAENEPRHQDIVQAVLRELEATKKSEANAPK